MFDDIRKLRRMMALEGAFCDVSGDNCSPRCASARGRGAPMPRCASPFSPRPPPFAPGMPRCGMRRRARWCESAPLGVPAVHPGSAQSTSKIPLAPARTASGISTRVWTSTISRKARLTPASRLLRAEKGREQVREGGGGEGRGEGLREEGRRTKAGAHSQGRRCPLRSSILRRVGVPRHNMSSQPHLKTCTLSGLLWRRGQGVCVCV